MNLLLSPKSESGFDVIKALKTKNIIIEKSINNNISKFSSQEIVLILLFGAGIPVFFVLVAVILYRRCNINKMTKDKANTKIEKLFEPNLNNKEKDTTKNLNKVLLTKNSDIIKNNIFDKEHAELNEKIICIKTISADCQNEKRVNKTVSDDEFKLVENNIYSIYNYDPSMLKLANKDKCNVNCKNFFKNSLSNTKFTDYNNTTNNNILATIV